MVTPNVCSRSWLAVAALGLALLVVPGCAGLGTRVDQPDTEFAAMPARDRLESHVVALCADGPGGRHRDRPEAYARAEAYLVEQLEALGVGDVEREYVPGYEGLAPNLFVQIGGVGAASEEIVVIGAHYDSVGESPGADDNASGVAVVIELARAHADAVEAGEPFDRTVRYILFTNEENPYFSRGEMGSQHHARRARQRGEQVSAMLAVEMVGYYSDVPGSQRYPIPVPNAPEAGNFLAVVGRLGLGDPHMQVGDAFRGSSDLPLLSVGVPSSVRAIYRSDHSSFWAAGYPAAMITDTADFRSDLYHTQADTPDTLDYERMSQALDGLIGAVRALATE